MYVCDLVLYMFLVQGGQYFFVLLITGNVN